MKKKRNKKLYTILGAEQFQKVVFIIERIKYRIIDKFFPNINKWYEKQCDKQFLRLMRKQRVDNKQKLLNEYQKQKLAFRKELVYKQNRNYHYDHNYPTQFIKYLEMNKKIHQRGIKKNIVALIGIGIFTFIFGNPLPTFSIICTIWQLASMVINFECINLQNYNLSRFQNERMYNHLKKKEEKNFDENLKKLSEGIKPVSKTLNSQIELPSIDQIVENITTPAQAKQLLEYVKEQYVYLQEFESKKKIKKIGGSKNV